MRVCMTDMQTNRQTCRMPEVLRGTSMLLLQAFPAVDLWDRTLFQASSCFVQRALFQLESREDESWGQEVGTPRDKQVEKR